MTPAATRSPEVEAARDRAAQRAVELVEDGMVVGLGTGDTARRFIERLAQRVREESMKLTCVVTSGGSAGIARAGGLTVRTLAEAPDLDLAVDGADEVTPALDLMKGGGGAHTKEKIVAASAARFVVLVDETKLVRKLGDTFPVPAEVIEDALPLVRGRLEAMGAVVTQREGVTELGNRILDARFGPIEDPAALSMRLDAIPGLLEHGLFIGMAHLVLVGDLSSETVRRLTPAT